MKTETIVMCVVALILGMLMFHMLKNVCGCKNVEGAESKTIDTLEQLMQVVNSPGGWLPTPGEAGGPFKVGDQVVVRAGLKKATSTRGVDLLPGQVAIVTANIANQSNLYISLDGNDLFSGWNAKDLAWPAEEVP